MIITICQNCNRPATQSDGMYAYCSDTCAALHFAALNDLHNVLIIKNSHIPASAYVADFGRMLSIVKGGTDV